MPLNLELHNNAEDRVEDIGVTSFVTAHTEYINYNKHTDAASTMISFIGSEPQTPQKNLFIKDLSWKHPRNNINYILEFEETKNNLIFKVPFKEIYVTNITNGNKEPLWFKHSRKFKPDTEVTLSKREYGEFVEGESINSNGWKVVNGFLYNNYENKFNFLNGSYELYYVTGIDEEGNPVNELLSNTESIGEFSWRDIDLDTGEFLQSGYTRNQVGSMYEFNISLSSEESCDVNFEKLYLRTKSDNIIKLLPPDSVSLDTPWGLKIQNGFFFSNFKYYISEYLSQNFDPEVGIIKLYNRRCQLVSSQSNSHIIKLPIKNILHAPEKNIYITVITKTISGEVIRGITSNPELIGNPIEDSTMEYELGVTSVDEKSGFVELEKSIQSNEEIYCSFHHKATNYFLTDIDLNPIANPRILEGRYYLYLKPNMTALEKSIQWLYLNKDDVILSCSDETLKVEIKSNQGHLIYNGQTVIKTSLDSFKSKYCYGYNNDYQYLELGEISYRETDYLDEVTEFSIKDRTPVDEKNYSEFVERQWKILQSKFGYGEGGQVYQDNNILYISLPIDLLETFGGAYKEKELYDLVKSKLHVSSEIIFDWDYYDLEIDLSNSEEDKVKVTMSWEGPGVYTLKRIVSEVNNEGEIVQEFDLLERPEGDRIEFIDESIDADIVNVFYYYEFRQQVSEIAGIRIRRT
jgi:hypothetical protein